MTTNTTNESPLPSMSQWILEFTYNHPIWTLFVAAVIFWFLRPGAQFYRLLDSIVSGREMRLHQWEAKDQRHKWRKAARVAAQIENDSCFAKQLQKQFEEHRIPALRQLRSSFSFSDGSDMENIEDDIGISSDSDDDGFNRYYNCQRDILKDSKKMMTKVVHQITTGGMVVGVLNINDRHNYDPNYPGYHMQVVVECEGYDQYQGKKHFEFFDNNTKLQIFMDDDDTINGWSPARILALSFMFSINDGKFLKNNVSTCILHDIYIFFWIVLYCIVKGVALTRPLSSTFILDTL